MRSRFVRGAVAMLFLLPGAGSRARAQAPSMAWLDRASFEYAVTPNIVYRTVNNVDLKLDLYLPPNRKPPVPVVMVIHGGGWVAGNKEENALTFLPYLAMGWAAVNVEYRLAGSSNAPAAVEDCRCALGWILQNAAENGLDPKRIVTTGYSAGGHLALTTGMLEPKAGFDRGCQGKRTMDYWGVGAPPMPTVAAIVNWFGITDVAGMLEGAPNARGYAIEWIGNASNAFTLATSVSPLAMVRAGIPPILTIHGDQDPWVPYSDGARLHEALQKARLPNQLLTIAGGKHGDFTSAENDRIWATIRQFLRQSGLPVEPTR
jgi:acetyl esterase/lipase